MSSAALPLPHALLGVAIAAVWGSNFVIIREGLEHLPPLLFAGLRFLLVFLAALLFLRRPNLAWSELAAYGLFIGVGQFGLLFLAVDGLISPGLASLVAQTQVFFTIGLAIYFNGEKVAPIQWLALMLAASGLIVIGLNNDSETTLAGLFLMLGAALCWALGNMVARRAGRIDMVAYVGWSSLFAAPPLLLLSLVFEGPNAISRGLMEADLGTWGAVIWQAVGNSLFGYAAWAWLLARHPAALVTPLALLVPVFGLATSFIWLGEPMPGWKIIAAGLVMAGLALNLFWPMFANRRS
jgi:O-acetylserine/cysteine efflux transporter